MLALAAFTGCDDFNQLRDCARLADGGRVSAEFCPFDAGAEADRDAGTYRLEAFFKAALPTIGGRFGRGLSVSPSGNVVVVGDNQANEVTVFEFDGGWRIRETLRSDPASNFGRSVSIAPDESTIVVGAPGAGFASAVNGARLTGSVDEGLGVSVAAHSPRKWMAGASFLDGGTCGCEAGGVRLSDGGVLLPPAEFAVFGGGFGTRVLSTLNGNRLIVGAPNEDGGPVRSGAVYVYDETPAGWALSARLTNPDLLNFAGLGTSLAANAAGTVVVASAPSDFGPSGSQQFAGSASVFSEMPDGGWGLRVVREATIRAVALYGAGLAMSADGDTLAVGGTGAGSMQGAVDIYDGKLQLVQHLEALPGTGFGSSVALSADARLLVVSAGSDPSLCSGVWPIPCGGTTDGGSGAVYVFRRK